MSSIEVLIQPIDSIIVPEERHRKVFVEANIEDLAKSINEHGLFHAPIVRSDGVTLVAGERRLRAIKHLLSLKIPITYNERKFDLGTLPVVSIAAKSELNVRLAEADENVIRVDLTWQEKADAVAGIHELRKLENPEHTEQATAAEVFPEERDERNLLTKVKDVKNDLLVTRFAEIVPAVKKAKTRGEALKIIEDHLTKVHNEKKAEHYVQTKPDSRHDIILGDMFEHMAKLPDNNFDCLVCDPPYGVNADEFKNQKAVKHDYDDTIEYAEKVITFILTDGLRVTRNKAHLYMFCDILLFQRWKDLATKIGWDVFKTPLIWSKGNNVGVLPRPDHGPRRTYEAILYAIKGNKPVKIAGAPDVIIAAHDRTIERGAHKPAELYADLISRSCSPGDKVLDPTCGTGPVFEAAEACHVRATGIEIDKAAIAMCYERLEEK